MNYIIPKLPLIQNVESINIFKHCINANKKLAELKGIANTIPNQDILINMLTLQEAKDSSEIENIVTTQDEIFKAELFKTNISLDTKEVQNYIQALKVGFNNVTRHNILTTNHILDIHETLEKNRAGFRTSKGTVLKNNKNEIVYSPPQNYADILLLMNNLEQYINDDEICSLDPLIKMAIVHHQFESIHPFYDGNGRTGRIINILYLICKDLLNNPILYLSRYIIKNKAQYYNLLQDVRDNNNWEDWIIFILNSVEQTANETIELVKKIKDLMQKFKQELRSNLPKLYSQDLLNSIFKHPYTKIEYLQRDLNIDRKTAGKYLNLLAEHNFMHKEKVGNYNYYLNFELLRLFV